MVQTSFIPKGRFQIEDREGRESILNFFSIIGRRFLVLGSLSWLLIAAL
jgi:hypothetical protein